VRHLANGYLTTGNDGRAKQYLEMAVALDSSAHAMIHRLGLLSERMGLQRQAIAHLQTAAKLAPEIADYHADLGAVYVRAEMLGPAL
jgi:Tfp pilus assembly protein PilF